MKIQNLKVINKGNLISRCSIDLENIGITIHECLLMKNKDGHKFISFPSKQYEKEGKKKWFSYVYMNKERKEQFDKEAIDMIEKLLPKDEQKEAPYFNDSEFPF